MSPHQSRPSTSRTIESTDQRALFAAKIFAILVIAIMVGRYSPIEQSSFGGPMTIAMTQPDFATGTAYWTH